MSETAPKRVYLAQPAQPDPPAGDPPRPKLRCPKCANLVPLPATECPFCRVDLRTAGLGPAKTAAPMPERPDRPEGGPGVINTRVFKAQPDTLEGPRPLPKLRCPNCAKLVTLPATECPFCRTDLRTGLAPKEEIAHLGLRKALKALNAFILVLAALLLGFIGPAKVGQAAKSYCYAALGLEICAPDQNLTRELMALGQAALRDMVRAGFQSWNANRKTRVADSRTANRGEQFSEAKARRDYFFATLAELDEEGAKAGAGPAADDLFAPLLGEWDVVWIEAPGTPAEAVAEGEWIFSLVGGGLALEDILAVPYLNRPPAAGDPAPLRLITLRQFNGQRGVWDCVRLQPEGLLLSLARLTPTGDLEEMSVDGRGETILKRITDLTPESFRMIVKTSKSGKSAAEDRLVGELWAKKRVIVAP
ncbi:MAG: hypothetical protein LBV21_04750 [Candidatus Adiutrix sp.]|jgi:hypothetical protein|nr:hypothetical protein [Candidatus Adiutrix sp.]